MQPLEVIASPTWTVGCCLREPPARLRKLRKVKVLSVVSKGLVLSGQWKSRLPIWLHTLGQTYHPANSSENSCHRDVLCKRSFGNRRRFIHLIVNPISLKLSYSFGTVSSSRFTARVIRPRIGRIQDRLSALSQPDHQSCQHVVTVR